MFYLKIAYFRENIRYQRKFGNEMKREDFLELKGTFGSSTCSGQQGKISTSVLSIMKLKNLCDKEKASKKLPPKDTK